MSEPMVIALISAGATLIVTVVTSIINVRIEVFRNKFSTHQKRLDTKNENLNNVYRQLISIINLYPSSSPNDILKHIKYAPGYSMGYYDAVLRSLDHQIEDFKKQLNTNNINYEQKSDLEIEISNREYAKSEILENKKRYNIAKEEYDKFCKGDKVVFNLYAGQEVRNSFVAFEVVIHNVFISGENAGDESDPINNSIHIARRNLINSMRSDLGITD
ncbi:hypothetical protein ACW0KB_20830 [Virgibacillus salarius]